MSQNLCIQTRVTCPGTTRNRSCLTKGPGSGHMPTLHHSLDISIVLFPSLSCFHQYIPGVCERLAGHGYGVSMVAFPYIIIISFLTWDDLSPRFHIREARENLQ